LFGGTDRQSDLCWVCYWTAYWEYRDCTVFSWTVLTVITQKLLLHVQLHNSTAHLLYKYCTNCTVCNWTVLTVIKQKLLLQVQMYNSTTHLLYKYCTNCTACNWNVLTVITQKLLLHVQLHSTFTAQILYKLYSVQLNCTYSNYTEDAVTCSAAQHIYCTSTVQTVQCATELYLH